MANRILDAGGERLEFRVLELVVRFKRRNARKR